MTDYTETNKFVAVAINRDKYSVNELRHNLDRAFAAYAYAAFSAAHAAFTSSEDCEMYIKRYLQQSKQTREQVLESVNETI